MESWSKSSQPNLPKKQHNTNFVDCTHLASRCLYPGIRCNLRMKLHHLILHLQLLNTCTMCHKETNSWYFPMIFPGNLKISAPASSALSMSLRPLIPCQDLNLRLQEFQILTSESWASKEKNLCIMSIVNYKNTYIYVINIHTYMLYIHIYVCICPLKIWYDTSMMLSPARTQCRQLTACLSPSDFKDSKVLCTNQSLHSLEGDLKTSIC